jgi:hypothetical protein
MKCHCRCPHRGQRRSQLTVAPHLRQYGFIGMMPAVDFMAQT